MLGILEFQEIAEEFETWLVVELVAREEAIMAAQMTSVVIRGHQYVLVLTYCLEGNATPADDRVVLNVINQSGNTDILNAITGRTVVIIRLKTFR